MVRPPELEKKKAEIQGRAYDRAEIKDMSQNRKRPAGVAQSARTSAGLRPLREWFVMGRRKQQSEGGSDKAERIHACRALGNKKKNLAIREGGAVARAEARNGIGASPKG